MSSVAGPHVLTGSSISSSKTAVWYHSGKPVVPIRWVLIRDPEGRFAPQALLATNPQLRPVQILTYFVRRWQMETTFEEARAYLGVETQRQWSDQATARSTPAWYRKAHATFSDTIALVCHCLWRQCQFAKSQAEADMLKIPRILYERLTDTLCYAA